MGANGSTTAKVDIIPQLHHFTQYGRPELESFWVRGMGELSETFALRQHEFEFLLNSKLVTLPTCRFLFNQVLDTDKNALVDKMEVMCLVCLCSQLSNAEKVEFLFELFNFNEKGYIVESEMALLILSITRVVAKVDHKFKDPPKPVWKHVIDLAYEHFAHIDTTKKSLRKPELVAFAAGVPQVTNYLDAFRGHAAQVFIKMKKWKPTKKGDKEPKIQLTADGKKWTDVYFPCNESAIIPLKGWITEGLVPYHFVRWRRRQNVGEITATTAYPFLFSHKRSVLRTLDKRKLYYGPGILGNGYLKQGVLADRWLLNGLAACLGNPMLIESLFSTTGQEDTVGRFNVRIFEGSGWRGLYVDDRIPCNPQCTPLFAQSSDTTECWPFIFEKAMAKYFGSYGTIGLCSKRMDATLASIRLTTGAHVYREAVADYEWKNVDFEVSSEEKNASKKIGEILKEGSLICLGRSEGMALHTNCFKQSPRIAPPHGYLYPIVANYTDAAGYKFVKIRDAFHDYLSFVGESHNTNKDYQKDERRKVDEMSGHCNTVTIPLEKLPDLFDTLILVRFPDALRPVAEKMSLVPWRTDYLKMRTRGKENPAKFLLKVIGHPRPPQKPDDALQIMRLSKLREKQANEMVVSDDIVSQDMSSDFNFERKRTFPTAEKTRQENPIALSDAEMENLRKRENLKMMLTPIDVCLTVSSTCPWGVGGAPEAGAKIRLRVVPSIRTIKALRVIRKKKQEIVAEAEAKAAEALARQKALLAADGEAVPADDDVDEEGEEEGKEASDKKAADGVEKAPDSARSKSSKKRSESQAGESDSGSGSDVSDSDSDKGDSDDSDASTKEVNKADEEAARLAKILEKERVLELEWFETRVSAEQCWISKSVKLYPGEYYILADVTYDLPDKRIFHLASPREKTEWPWLDGRPLEVNKVCLQTTSTGQFQVNCLWDQKACPRHGMSVASVTMHPSKWPFSAENQDETASRGLIKMVSDLREQIKVSGALFYACAQEFKSKFRHKLKLYKAHLDEEAEKKRLYDLRMAEIARLEEERVEEERQMVIYKAREAKIRKEKERALKTAGKNLKSPTKKGKDEMGESTSILDYPGSSAAAPNTPVPATPIETPQVGAETK